jgi:hypothetical protein
VGASNDLSFDGLHYELDVDSSSSPTEGTGSTFSSPLASPTSPSSGISSDQPEQKGHYRGITFEEILPPHLITNAPASDVDQKQERRKSVLRRPNSESSTSAATTTETESPPLPPPPTKRAYATVKHSTGGKSRLRATARALARHLTVVKRDHQSRRGYEVV